MNVAESKKRLTDIASHLDGWILKPDRESWEHGGSIVNNEGGEIFFRWDYYRKKAWASGQWPNNEEGRYMSASDWRVIGYNEKDDTRIGFNIYKTPDKIAQDIKRRLLPNYLPNIKLVYKKLVEAKLVKKLREERIKSFARLFGEEPYNYDKNRFSYFKSDDYAVEVSCSYKDFKIKIDYLEYEKALKVLQVLRSL